MTIETIHDTDLRREAESIFEDVRDAGVDLSDGTSGRIGYMSSTNGLTMKTRNGLYCGQLGIALYFAAMYEVFDDELYRRHVERAVEFLVEGDVEEVTDSAYIGAGSGIGSSIYGMSLLAELTGDQRYEERAKDFVAVLSEELIAEDTQYDLLLGTSGTLMGLLRYWEHSNDSEALDKAVRCGEHLLESRYEKWNSYRLWDTSKKDGVLSTSTGMGHGVAGIAYALYRLYGHTEREEFRRAADNATAFENLFYSNCEENWKANFGGVKHYSNWWCNGLVGIGSARLGSLEYHGSDTLKRDLNRVEEGFSPRILPEDSICHGTFGQVDLLIELGRKYGDQYLEAARELTSKTIAARREAGEYRVNPGHIDGLDNPVLFLGTAGIGYVLLRLLRPEKVPSVLRFE